MKLIFKQPSDCPAPPSFRGSKVKKVVKSDMDWKTVDSTVTNLEIDSNCLTGNGMSFLKASNLNSLKTLHFKDSCASSIECVTIRNNPYLTDLTVGNNCFSLLFDPNQDLYLAPEGETPRIFCVMLNFSLEHISIGRFSFTRYSTFTLARCSVPSPSRIVLPNLTTLSIGEWNDSTAIEDGSFCFSFTQSFTLSGKRFIALCPLYVDLPKLATVKIGNYCFSKVWNVTLKSCFSPMVWSLDLPSLNYLLLSNSVFKGDYTCDECSMSWENLPALVTLIMKKDVCSLMSSVQMISTLLSTHWILDCFLSKKPLNFDIHDVFGMSTKLRARGCREDAIKIIKSNISVLLFFCWKHVPSHVGCSFKTLQRVFHWIIWVYGDQCSFRLYGLRRSVASIYCLRGRRLKGI